MIRPTNRPLGWFCLLVVTLAIGGLGGCTLPDESAQRGTPPAIEASLLRQDTIVQLPDPRRLPINAHARLLGAVRLVALGEPRAVRATIVAQAVEAQTVRQALIGLGIDPARIRAANADSAEPSVARVSLARFVLHTRDCIAAIQPSTNPGIDVASSLDSVGRCVQSNNLAAMLVDPGDLLASTRLGPTPGADAVAAIIRERTQRGGSAVTPGLIAVAPTTAGSTATGTGTDSGAR